MKLFNKNKLAIVLLAAFIAIILTGCGTTKNFVVDSNPKGALLVAQWTEGSTQVFMTKVNGVFASEKGTPICEIPATVPVYFETDTSKVTFIAEKRGYTSSSYDLNKDSAEAVFFDLKKIDGVPETTFKKEDLASGGYYLLPAFVEVHIHSGLGMFEKVELSPEASLKVTEDLNTELLKTLDGNKQISWAKIDEPMKTDWQNLSSNLNKYLLKLDANRLQYYSLPPYVTANVEGFKPFIEKFGNQPGNDKPYLLYVWSKCVSETTGRKVGVPLVDGLNFALGHPERTSFIYGTNPSLLTSGTLAVIYVIDAKTSEVVYIEQRQFSDITDGGALKAMASTIGKFPTTDEKMK